MSNHKPSRGQTPVKPGAASLQVLVNTDANISGNEALEARVTAAVVSAVSSFTAQLTRIEVHLSDENGPKAGEGDIRCMMEAHLEGHQPLAVTEHATTVDEAVDAAAEALAKVIEHTLGRLHTFAQRHGPRA
jgi:ribosome-associated translation inhibitor RaiA